MEIDIKASVLSHFRDLGITSDEQGSVYENAQARERAQVLMDIANMHNGLVVGTGDLSEAALGFCTFGGDHALPLQCQRHYPQDRDTREW